MLCRILWRRVGRSSLILKKGTNCIECLGRFIWPGFCFLGVRGYALFESMLIHCLCRWSLILFHNFDGLIPPVYDIISSDSWNTKPAKPAGGFYPCHVRYGLKTRGLSQWTGSSIFEQPTSSLPRGEVGWLPWEHPPVEGKVHTVFNRQSACAGFFYLWRPFTIINSQSAVKGGKAVRTLPIHCPLPPMCKARFPHSLRFAHKLQCGNQAI